MLLPLSEAGERCGAKAANLARLLREGVRVPAGFVIEDALGDDGWVQELEPALRCLGPGPYAVRSSALGEDGGEASFAGQLHTTLGATTAAQVARAVRRAATSGTGSGAAAYSRRTGRVVSAVVPVIVQLMVRAEVAGVLFTRHPVTGADQVVIEAHRGLGDNVVNGGVTPQTWMVSGHAVTGPRTAADPVLTTPHVLALVGTARRIEASFGSPQDIEWAIADGVVWVLQARPITTTATTAEQGGPVPQGAGTVLVRGTPASGGIARGPVRVIGGLDDFTRFHTGDVLVCRTTSPAWTPLLARAAAVVTEIGGILAHAAIVAREFGIPAVMGAGDATGVLTDAMPVVVDGTSGSVTGDHTQENQHGEKSEKSQPTEERQ